MNIRRKLTIVITQLFCGLLLLCSGAWAQQTLITFDDVPDGTRINTRYPGVTFSTDCWTYGDVFAKSSPNAPSSANVVSCSDSPNFSAAFGVTATFSVPQLTVSIDVRPVVTRYNGANGSATDRPYMWVHTGGLLATEVRYAGPLPNSGVGPVERLTFTSSSANITHVRFNSPLPQTYIMVSGLFDNFRFSPTSSGEVPGNGLTLSGPAPIFFNNELRLFIRGTDNRIYENVLTQGGVWTGWWEVPDYGKLTLSGPAATVLGNKLYLFVRGAYDRIYQNVLTPGVSWTGWSEVPGNGLTPSGPAATVHDNKLHLLITGYDDRIYQNVLAPGLGTTWWWEVPDSPLTPSEPRAISYDGGLHIFVRDNGGRILMRSYF
jgi:hypothetical protein